MSIVVCGATGNVGQRIVREALDRGQAPTRRVMEYPRRLSAGARYWSASRRPARRSRGMGGTYVDRAQANSGGGTMIGILFLVVALALVGTVGWGVVGGGFDPPSGQTGKHGTTATTGERGPVVAAGTP